MLDVNEVCKSYGKLVAVNDHVSLKVRPGEIAVLLGLNGAGQSILIKCITGLLRFSGSITIDGYPNNLDAKCRLGYVPEHPLCMTLLTFCGDRMTSDCAYRVQEENYARELLERPNCGQKRNNWQSHSSGHGKTINLLCFAVFDSQVIVFDELIRPRSHAIKQLKNSV